MHPKSLDEQYKQLLLEEQEHKVRKAKAEADLAEMSLAYGRQAIADKRTNSLS